MKIFLRTTITAKLMNNAYCGASGKNKFKRRADCFVIPAQAGIQCRMLASVRYALDSRLRGNDGGFLWGFGRAGALWVARLVWGVFWPLNRLGAA